jgi:putative spermidine/putrescine transport system substrate-binding protein
MQYFIVLYSMRDNDMMQDFADVSAFVAQDKSANDPRLPGNNQAIILSCQRLSYRELPGSHARSPCENAYLPRLLRSVVATAACCTALLAIPLSSALAETLVVAGYGASVEKIMREKVIPSFEQEHGVTIQYIAGNSTDTLAKLQAQRGSQQIDVAMMDDGPMAQAISLGLCATIEGLNTSEFLEIASFPGNKGMGMGLVASGLMYNTKIFAENGWPAPTSWNDLKDPKFAGKVVLPPINNGYGLLATIMLARMGGGGEANIEPGFAAMKQVAANVLAFEPSPAKMTEMFQTGEAALAVWGSARYQAFANTGFPVAFIYPHEGAPALMTGVCPVAKAAVSQKAQAFVAKLLSADVQKIMADLAGYAPVRRGVDVVTPGVMPIGERASQVVAVDWSVINPVRDDWTRRWSREIER